MTDQTTGQPRLVGARYQLVEQIGRGGMAEVWSAHDNRLGRHVAVKLLRTDLARDPSFQARFKREAQSSASLNHPAIVSVYDTGEDSALDPYGSPAPQPYIVMEQVHGRTVKQILQESSPLDIDDAMRITVGVLDALQYSHRGGIIHRDIKPGNVMVTDAGEIKVMDFGIARAIADTSATMTGTNAVMGTAQYLSPEQARGETVDERSDLYSAGCLLYELLTGRPPFVGENALALAYQHVGETPRPPSSLNPEVPADLDTVVLHALAKAREDRYQDAPAFVADLDRVATGLSVSAFPLAGAAAVVGADTVALTSRVPRTPPAPVVATDPRWPDELDDRRILREPEDREPNRTWLYVVLVLLALGAIAALLFLFLGGTGDDGVDAVRMPEVTGLQQADAVADLEGLGFTDITVTEDPEAEADSGIVTEQDPLPSDTVTTVPVTTPVTLTIAVGPGQVVVPPLTGMSQAEARDALVGAGLTFAGTSEADDPVAARGLVLSSEPAAGATVEEGADVTLVLASGRNTVPSVIGMAQPEAIKAVQDAGFDVVTENRESPEPPGTVIAQGGTEDRRLDVGDTVTLTLATAPPPTPSTVTETFTPAPSQAPPGRPSAEPSGVPTG